MHPAHTQCAFEHKFLHTLCIIHSKNKIFCLFWEVMKRKWYQIVYQTWAHLGKYVHCAQQITPARKHGDDEMCRKFSPERVNARCQDFLKHISVDQVAQPLMEMCWKEKWKFVNVGKVAPAVAVPGATWAHAAQCQQLSIEIHGNLEL